MKQLAFWLDLLLTLLILIVKKKKYFLDDEISELPYTFPPKKNCMFLRAHLEYPAIVCSFGVNLHKHQKSAKLPIALAKHPN